MTRKSRRLHHASSSGNGCGIGISCRPTRSPPARFPATTRRCGKRCSRSRPGFITHLIRQDQGIDELLHGDATFVNETLAKYYGDSIATQFRSQRADDLIRRGLPAPADPKSDWYRVEGLRSSGRGGLFGMPVILTKNSAGQRTSPVKRGFWVVHHLLGQHFPPPPADVPELPKTEKEGAKTVRELLAQHTTQRQCAMCHVHFDGLGLTMEGFDAIGRARGRRTSRAESGPGDRPHARRTERRRDCWPDRLCQ